MSQPRRILVVDDDAMVAATIQRVLRPEGYDVDSPWVAWQPSNRRNRRAPTWSFST